MEEEKENIFDYLDLKADEWEPYAAGAALGGVALGAGLGATVVGAPFAVPVTVISLVPSLAIDGYQAARDWYKGNVGNALWNTLETALDVAGAKIVKGGADLLSTAKTAKVAPKTFQSTKVGIRAGITPKARKAAAEKAAEANRKLAIELNNNSMKLAKKWALEKYGRDFSELSSKTLLALRDRALNELRYGATRRANLLRALEMEESANKWLKRLAPLVWAPNFVDVGGAFIK